MQIKPCRNIWLLDFPDLNKNAEFLGLKFNIDSADDRLCNCNYRKMYSSTILFEFRRDLGGISSKNLHYLFLD